MREEPREEPRAIEAPPESEEAEAEFSETVTRKVIENPTEQDYERFKASGDHEVIQGEGGFEHGEHEEHHESDHDDHKSSYSHHHHSKSHGGHRSPSPEREGHRSRSVKRSKSKYRSKSRHHRSKSRRRSGRGSEDYRETRIEYDDDEASKGGRFGLELLVPDRTRRKDKDLKAEIRALEAEKRALRHEREAEDRRHRHRHRDYSSSNSDDGEVRIEKDRRGRLNLVRSE